MNGDLTPLAGSQFVVEFEAQMRCFIEIDHKGNVHVFRAIVDSCSPEALSLLRDVDDPEKPDEIELVWESSTTRSIPEDLSREAVQTRAMFEEDTDLVDEIVRELEGDLI
jgi:hypothetical protein